MLWKILRKNAKTLLLAKNGSLIHRYFILVSYYYSLLPKCINDEEVSSLLNFDNAPKMSDVELYAATRLVNRSNATLAIIESMFLEIRNRAHEGNCHAMNNLAVIYERGNWIEKDFIRAFLLFKKAAKQGFGCAQFNVAMSFYYGDGIEPNKAKVAKWLEKAAEQGLAWAQNRLAHCYYFGEGVEEDKVMATKWFRRAAERGLADAQYSLAVCYVYGHGIRVNKKEAMKWFKKAAKGGSTDAQSLFAILENISKQTMDDPPNDGQLDDGKSSENLSLLTGDSKGDSIFDRSFYFVKNLIRRKALKMPTEQDSGVASPSHD